MADELLVTGGAGDVAALIRPYLRDEYRLRLADRTRPDDVSYDEDVIVGDLADADLRREAVSGVDAVIHLAGNPDFSAPWSHVERANVTLTEQVLRAARDAAVPRVVLASSIHAMGQYVRDGRIPVDPSWPSHPCCLYGASKAAAESLSDVYSDRYGLSTICLRLGWVSDVPRHPLALDLWASPRDVAGFVAGAVATPAVRGAYFAMSDNTASRWRIDASARALGYRAADDAANYADKVQGIDPDAKEVAMCLPSPTLS